MLDLLDIFVRCGLGKRVWYFVQKLPAVKHNHFRFGFHILSFAAYSSEYQQQSTPIVDVIQEHLLLFPIYIINRTCQQFLFETPAVCSHFLKFNASKAFLRITVGVRNLWMSLFDIWDPASSIWSSFTVWVFVGKVIFDSFCEKIKFFFG